MNGSEKANRTKEVKKALRTKFFFVGIVIVTIILLWAVSSLAWFSWGIESNVESNNLKVQEAESIYIRTINDGNWYQSLDVSYFPLKAICGNGKDFFKPVYSKTPVPGASLAGVSVYTETITAVADFEAGESLADYALVKEFEIMADTPSNYIYISSSSFLSPDLESSEGSCLNSSGLSSAHIAGAMRVSLSVYSSAINAYELKMVWIPNPKCRLYTYGTNDNWTVDYSVSEGAIKYSGTPEQAYTIYYSSGAIDNANIVDFISYNESTGYYKNQSTGVIYVWDLDKLRTAPNGEGALLSGIEAEQIYQLKMVVWVEGTDRECKNALLGGKTSLLIQFVQGD